MFSIKLKDPYLLKEFKMVAIESLVPHEKVIKERQSSLRTYLNSYQNYCVIPSIICCKDSGLIIDGHHRYKTLLDLGAKEVPVTFIDYESVSIRTHSNPRNQISKNQILKAAISGKLLAPKSTIHEVMDELGVWKPLILISTLSEVKIHKQ